MTIPTFVQFDAKAVSHALRHWYWYLGDPEDLDDEVSALDVLGVTAFGDLVIWDDYDTRILVTRGCSFDRGDTPKEKAEFFMGSYEFREKYIYFNDAQFAEQVVEVAGALCPNQCYAPILYNAAGGSYSDPRNFAVTEIDQHLTISGIISHLANRLPDNEWANRDKVIGERARINRILREAYPIIASIPKRP